MGHLKGHIHGKRCVSSGPHGVQLCPGLCLWDAVQKTEIEQRLKPQMNRTLDMLLLLLLLLLLLHL